MAGSWCVWPANRCAVDQPAVGTAGACLHSSRKQHAPTAPPHPSHPCAPAPLQQVKQTINLFARNGIPLCPGKISGGEFDSTGTILHLACEGTSKVVSLDATSMRQHKVLGNFTTARLPGSLAVGK